MDGCLVVKLALFIYEFESSVPHLFTSSFYGTSVSGITFHSNSVYPCVRISLWFFFFAYIFFVFVQLSTASLSDVNLTLPQFPRCHLVVFQPLNFTYHPVFNHRILWIFVKWPAVLDLTLLSRSELGRIFVWMDNETEKDRNNGEKNGEISLRDYLLLRLPWNLIFFSLYTRPRIN